MVFSSFNPDFAVTLQHDHVLKSAVTISAAKFGSKKKPGILSRHSNRISLLGFDV